MALKYAQTNTLYLAGAGVVISATSIVLSSFSDIYGNVLTMADFGTKGYITLEPDTTNEEAATFTGVTANANGTYTLTGVSTALAKSPYTESSGLLRGHSGGSKVVITDNVAFWNTFPNKNNDETILGTWTFNVAPSSLSATRASTAALGNIKLSQTASKSLGVATITIATPGVVTNTAHGLIAGDSVQFTTTGSLPTGLSASTDYYVIAAGLAANTFQVSLTVAGAAINTSGSQSGVHTLFRTTPFGVVDNDYRIFPNAYAADTGAANAYVVTLPTAPAAYVAGQMFAFKALNTNTTTSTLNVNGLGAKTIKGPSGSNLGAGDILAGQIVEVQYDGTNLQMLSPSANSYNGTQPVINTYTANATWTKPAGLKYVDIEVQAGGAGAGASGTAGNASGGGAGGYSRKRVLAAALGATETVTVGAAVAFSNSGNNSSFGAHATATGGTVGAVGLQTLGGAGGAGASGDININGQDGGASGFASYPKYGDGGNSMFGFGGAGRIGATNSPSGTGYGSGGAGTTNSGGGGAGGLVIVREYYA